MPISADQAKSICDDVVQFFRGAGSTNIVYTRASAKNEELANEAIVKQIDDRLHDTQIKNDAEFFTRRQEREKATSLIYDFLAVKESRNEAAAKARDYINDTRESGSGKNSIEYGQIIHGSKHVYGNCMEFSCLAAYFASKRNVKEEEIFILATEGDDNHAFCYIRTRACL